MSNSVDPRQILQALLARSGGILGRPQPQPQPQGPPGMGAIPGAMSQNQAPPPQAPSQLPQLPAQRPFTGTFGDRHGLISSIVNSAEKKAHDKKVSEAEMYYNQINAFLASGDEAHAHQLLDDPKIRKVLKTGLDFVPLEEEVPPEAIGVHQAKQKINAKQQAQKPPGRAVIPGAGVEQQLGIQKLLQDIATKREEAGKYTAEAGRATAEEAAVQPKVEAEKLARQAEADKSKADLLKAQKEMKESEEMSPLKQGEAKARINQLNALAEENKARAKYWNMGGKLPGSQLQTLIKSSRSDLISVFKDAVSDNNKIKDEMRKQSGVARVGAKFGLAADVGAGSYQAETRVRKLREAIQWFDSEGQQAVIDGKMSVSDLTKEAYKRAGMEAPPSGISGTTEPTANPVDDLVKQYAGQPTQP